MIDRSEDRIKQTGEVFTLLPLVDVIVGNPPYSEGGEGGRGGDAKLYREFGLLAMKLANIVAFVTPGTFKRQQKFEPLRQQMDEHGVYTIQSIPIDTFGVNVRVDDPTYWIVGGGSNTVADFVLDEHDHLLRRLALDPKQKRTWVGGQAPVCNNKHAAILSPVRTNVHVHPYVDRVLVKGEVFVFATNKLWRKHLPHGIVISQSCGDTPTVCFIATPFAHSQNAVAVQCTEQESIHFKHNVHLNLVRYWLKTSGRTVRGQRNTRNKAYAHTAKSLSDLIPNVMFTRSWTDEQLFKHFKLTRDEIKLIEDTVK